MKKKGITIWEQHLEHIVLAVAVLFFLGFGGWQLTRSPNEVNGVAPGEADPQLNAAVESLNARLGADPIDLPEYDPLSDTFASRMTRSVSPAEEFLVAAPAVDLGDGAQSDGGGERIYVTLDLPAPDRVITRTDYDALLPETLDEFPELAALMPSSSMDIEFNTVAARVDLAAIEAEFRQSGDAERTAIPENWYSGRIAILDVRVERQQWDGQGWGETTLVSPLPGAMSVRPAVAEATEAARERVFAAIENPAVRREIVQPQFLATLNDTWVAPDPLAGELSAEEAAGLTDEELEIQRLLVRLNRDRKERARLLARLIANGGTDPKEDRAGGEEDEGIPEGERRRQERQREREERRRSPGGDGGGGGFGAGPGPGGGGGRNEGGGQRRSAPGGRIGGQDPGAGGDGERDAAQRERMVAQLRRNIIQLDRKIDEWSRQLLDLGVNLDAEAEQVDEVAADPFASDELAIWAFDIDVESGATYRYRVAVELYNPFFRRRIDLSEAQFELAESMSIATRSSEWSDPVEVLPPTSFYVTEAYPSAGELGMGTLRAEVFRFEGGRWWKESFVLEPGEVIGEEKRVRGPAGVDAPELIDYGTGWYVLDVMLALDADAAARDAGLGGDVIVQRIDDGTVSRIESPRSARGDRRRLDLDRMVRDAEDAAELEAARGE
jgi:hypothetical protein